MLRICSSSCDTFPLIRYIKLRPCRREDLADMKLIEVDDEVRPLNPKVAFCASILLVVP